MDNPVVSILDFDQFLNLVYNKKTGECNDPTVFDRIRYFSNGDFHYMQRDKVKPFFAVLTIKNKIIGLAKAGYFDLSAKSERNWSISFFSIDKEYRGLGYSRLMVDAIFRHAKLNNYEISPSCYTVLGKEYVHHLLVEYAKIHDVLFYDEVTMHDLESMYVIVNGKKLHHTEVDK